MNKINKAKLKKWKQATKNPTSKEEEYCIDAYWQEPPAEWYRENWDEIVGPEPETKD